MRVLVAFEDNYRIYREALASAIRDTYPRLEVVVADVRDLQAEMAHSDPHLVICSSSQPAPLSSQQHGRISWIELSIEPAQPSLFCVDGQRWESFNPSLQEVFEVLEDTEMVLVGARRKTGEGAC